MEWENKFCTMFYTHLPITDDVKKKLIRIGKRHGIPEKNMANIIARYNSGEDVSHLVYEPFRKDIVKELYPIFKKAMKGGVYAIKP